MKKKLLRVLSASTLGLFAVGLAMSTGVYQFAISPYIHDYFNTSPTKVVARDDAEEQDTEYFKADYADTTELHEAKFQYIEDSVSEGTVLLKNTNSALPLRPNKDGGKTKVTLLGNASANLVYGMDAGAGQIANENQYCKHFDQALKDAGYDVNQTMYDFYANSGVNQNNPAGYYGLEGDLIIGEVDPSTFTPEVEQSLQEYNDAAIIVIARNVGEGFDLWSGESAQPLYQSGSGTSGSGTPLYQSALELTPYELALIEKAKSKNFGKIILMLNSNQQIALQGLENDPDIDAILQVGGLGYNGIDGFINVLSGEVAPSGKLINAWPSDSLSTPAAQNMGSTSFSNYEEVEDYFVANEAGYIAGPENAFRQIWYTAQMESIYIGYRYYETRYEDVVLGRGNAESTAGAFASTGSWNYDQEMAYTFGYGLSYTTFSQEFVGNPTFDDEKKTYTFTVRVTNTGTEYSGKEVVQIYAATPYTQEDIEHKVEKSAIQLAGFDKTDVLAPGEHEDLEIEVDLHDICSWDSESNGGEGGYILSEGTHYFALGNGAHDALNNVLAKKSKDGISVNKAKMDDEGNSDLVFSFDQNQRDEETYSVSQYTGERLTNQLEDADINYWLPSDKKATYLTRHDWTTFPEIIEGEDNGRASIKIEATSQMLLEMIGQTSVNGKDYSAGSLDEEAKDVVSGVGTEYQVSMMMGADYDDPNWDLILDQLSYEDLANIVAAGNGFTYACESIVYPGSRDGDGPIGWYSSTMEYKGDKWYNGTTGYIGRGGVVTEGFLPSRIYEGTLVCAASFNRDLEVRRGKLLGNEGIFLGRTGMWGISAANIGRTAFSGRNGEYYGEEPMIGAIMGAAVSSGYASKGGIAFTKHYAFNDTETNRYGGCVFMTEQTAREISLRAFEGILAPEEGITKSMGLMESFTRLGCTWVGESYPLMTQILRNEWGFQGAAITDMAVAQLTYYHAPEAVKAGTDYFDTTDATLYGGFFTKDKLEEDPVLHAALKQAAHRILYIYVNSLTMNGTPLSADLVRVLAPWEIAIICIDVVLGVIALGTLVLYVVVEFRRPKNEEGK